MMPDLTKLFREHEHQMPFAELQLFKDFIDGKINPKSAAISLTKDIDMTISAFLSLYRCLAIAMTLAISSVDSTIQKMFIQLLSVIRTLQKRSLNLGNETPSRFVLEDIDQIIGDWWSSLRSDSWDLKEPERHVYWIRLNEIAARLTKANICDWAPNASILCDELLDDTKLRENPFWFAIALSAAAQLMIHAGLNVYLFSKTQRTEKVEFGLWWIDFLSRSDGGSCPNKKNKGRRNEISIYIPIANSFTPERAFFVTKLLFRNQIPDQPRPCSFWGLALRERD